MNGKKLLIFFVIVAVLSFGGTFMLTRVMTPKAPPPVAAASQPASAPSAAELLPENAPLPNTDPKALASQEKKLDELAKELAVRLDDMRKRESRLAEREKRVGMAEEMLRKQCQELEGLRVAMAGPMQELKKAQEDLSASRVVVTKQEAVNIKKTATFFEKMEPAAGGKLLVEMVNNKQEDDAVKILRSLSDKTAAKMLGEISDKAVVAKLLDKLKRVTEQS